MMKKEVKKETKREVSKNRFKFLLIMVMSVTMFFMVGFIFLKLLMPKKPEVPVNFERIETQPLPQSLPQQPMQEQQILPQQPLQQPQQPMQEQGQNKESIKEISKKQEETIKIVSKDERDIFKDFYKAKRNKDGSTNPTATTPSTAPPLPPPPFNNQQGISLAPSQRLVDIVIYGFYTTEDKIFVLTNVGLLSQGSRISENETVVSITKNKIVTNLREIYF